LLLFDSGEIKHIHNVFFNHICQDNLDNLLRTRLKKRDLNLQQFTYIRIFIVRQMVQISLLLRQGTFADISIKSYIATSYFLLQVLDPPPGYQPLRTPSRKLTATPTPMGFSGFTMQV
jgi:hypothetical protein